MIFIERPAGKDIHDGEVYLRVLDENRLTAAEVTVQVDEEAEAVRIIVRKSGTPVEIVFPS